MCRAIMFAILACLFIACSGSSNPAASTAAQIDTMKSYDFQSINVGDTFVIDISLPASYSSDSNLSYPVIYVTDGYWRRGQHQPIHDMAKNENVKEMIVVGIGYPETYDPNTIRVRDLITHADRYLDFILKELIPYIEKNYRTNGVRTLWGSSFGGYFAMYTLFQYVDKTKGVFNNYIVASPACYQSTEYEGQKVNLFGYERMLSEKTHELTVNLYLTVGGDEDRNGYIIPFNKLVEDLGSRNYTGFFMKSYIDPGKNHYTVWEPALYEGIRMFMKN